MNFSNTMFIFCFILKNLYNAVASGKIEKVEDYLDMPGVDLNMTYVSNDCFEKYSIHFLIP
jgi:hypothetical protein